MPVKSLITDKKIIQKELAKKLSLKNALALPRVEKVSVNVSLGGLRENPKLLESISQEIALIAGQKPVVKPVRKSISSFKIRQGDPVGLAVTLRGKKMGDFLFRLFNVVLPRVRDFKGLAPKGFDQQGNFTLGLKEQVAFPEISPDQIHQIHGLEITIRIKNSDPQKSQTLLETLGVPILKTN